MPKRVQFRRGNTAQTAAFVGAQGEVTYNTETKRLTSHDGSTAGGHAHALVDEALLRVNNLADLASKPSARSALSVFSKDESYGISNIRSVSPRLYFDGVTSGQRLVCPLGFTIGMSEFTIRAAFRYPSSLGAARTLLYISSIDSAPAAAGLSVHITATGELEVRLYGASVSDYSYFQSTELFGLLAGKVVELHVVRSYLGVTLYVNGAAVASTPVGAFGTAPGFTAAVTSAYLVFGHGVAAASPFLGDLLALTFLNYALTLPQSDLLFRETLAAADQWSAFGDELISSADDRTFAGATNWANVDLAAYDASGDLSLSASAAAQKAKLPAGSFFSPVAAKRYYIECDVANLSGGPFALYNSNGTLLGSITQNGKFSCAFVVSDVSFGDLEIRSLSSGSVDLDNFSFRAAGAVLDLSLEESSASFVPDRSTNYLGIEFPVLVFVKLREGSPKHSGSNLPPTKIWPSTCRMTTTPKSRDRSTATPSPSRPLSFAITASAAGSPHSKKPATWPKPPRAP